jgi:hypothetical protein
VLKSLSTVSGTGGWHPETTCVVRQHAVTCGDKS